MSDKTGGPAFPLDIPTLEQVYLGMTMLDYFAGQAMQLYPMLHDEAAAKCSYARAAAMIKEREKRNDQTS